jgi:hypothetical protein
MGRSILPAALVHENQPPFCLKCYRNPTENPTGTGTDVIGVANGLCQTIFLRMNQAVHAAAG